MSIIYNLIFLAVAIFYLPIYLFRRKFHQGFLLRFGFLPQAWELNRPIWLHAVSVGEAMSVRGLVEKLRVTYPGKSLVISTVTATGNKIALTIAQEKDFVTYLPLDLSFIVRKVIDRINPSLFIIAETEFWPNLISYLDKRNIPVVTVNGRISKHSFTGYQMIKFLIRPLLNKISLFCVQTNGDAQRMAKLGVSETKLKVTGNMKFDTATDYLPEERADKYRALLGLNQSQRLWVAASTHPGEEEIVLGAYQELLREFPELRLLIAPRHPERASAVAGLIKNFNFQPKRMSMLNESTNQRINESTNQRTIFILDTIGQLLNYYALAEIVFVGGSLVKKIGGHNILEPASLGKPVIFGPYMSNFKDITDLFLQHRAAILVHHPAELKSKVRDLLNNPSLISQLAHQAKEVIRQNQGATQRNLEYIEDKFLLDKM